MKQERRGGIETCANQSGKSASSGKQERRGGIETKFHREGETPPPAKQERRGGIETVVLAEMTPRGVGEAGTPWWH